MPREVLEQETTRDRAQRDAHADRGTPDPEGGGALAAVDVVRDGGPETLALRELARRLGVSHNAAYRHFADREALVDVVAERALEAMVGLVHRRLSVVKETDMLNADLDDLVAVGFLSPEDREGADVTCWASVHGFAVLNIEGPLRGLAPEVRQATLSGLLLAIDRGLGARGDWPALVST